MDLKSARSRLLSMLICGKECLDAIYYLFTAEGRNASRISRLSFSLRSRSSDVTFFRSAKIALFTASSVARAISDWLNPWADARMLFHFRLGNFIGRRLNLMIVRISSSVGGQNSITRSNRRNRAGSSRRS